METACGYIIAVHLAVYKYLYTVDHVRTFKGQNSNFVYSKFVESLLVRFL